MTRITFHVLCSLVAVCFVQASYALVMFDAPQPLASNAATDPAIPTNAPVDIFPRIAGDGVGNWVAVWSSNDPAVVMPGALGMDAVFSRSVDDGRTWSPVTVLNSDAMLRDAAGQLVATNKEGTWIAALHGDAAEVEIVRSIDGGATWSYTLSIGDMTTSAENIRVVAGQSGQWMAIWRASPDASNMVGLWVSRSDDDGVTWSAADRVLSDGQFVDGQDARLATDRSGTWIIVWHTWMGTLYRQVSTDAGTTWSTAVGLGGSNASYAARADLATDGAGNWIVVWNTTLGVPGADQGDRTDFDIVAARSSDNGQTWSEAIAIGGAAALSNEGDRETPRVRYADGVWQVVWTQAMDSMSGTIGQEGDLVGVRSFDGGATWTDPAAINVNASSDNAPVTYAFPWKNIDFLPEFEHGGNGTSILVWTSTNSLKSTIDDEYDVFYARSHNDCPITPQFGCEQPTAEGSTLDLKNPVGGHDKLRWKWQATTDTPPDFGDPTTSTDYVLCVYDKAGGSLRSVFENDAAAASQCDGENCWEATPSGFRYRDLRGRNGPIAKLELVPGNGKRTTIRVNARGAALAPPVMPFALDPSMIVQLLNLESGLCWEATFSTADTNNSERFRGRSN